MRHDFSFLRYGLRAALGMVVLCLFALNAPRVLAATRTVGNGKPSSCTETALRNAITGATSGDKIVFKCGANPRTIGMASNIVIDKDLTIDGGSLITLTTNQADRIFFDDGGTLTLKNITLTNAKGLVGGCMYVGTGLIASNVKFQNCHSIGNGGALATFGTTELTDVTFTANDAPGDGGAIYNQAALTLNNVNFAQNSAGDDAGAVYNYLGTFNATGGKWTDNTAANYAGGLLNDQGAAILTRVKFLRNHALNYAGGGIDTYAGNLTLTKVTLSQNTAGTDGGGIHQSVGNTLMNGGSFNGNTALNGKGGGFFNEATATLGQVKFKNNQAQHGGGINNSNYAVVYSALFSGNQASIDGGGAENNGTTFEVTETTFDHNSATGEGGGINNNGDMSVYQTTFSFNTAQEGGAIENKGPVTMSNTTFSGNSATNQGGALETYASFALNFVTLSDNHATIGSTFMLQGGTLSLKNTVLAGASAANHCYINSGSILSLGYNLADDNSCSTYLNNANDRNSVNPKLGLLANNGGPTKTHLPLTKSPLINKGDCAGGPIIDQRGVARPQKGKCEIGAVEVQ